MSKKEILFPKTRKEIFIVLFRYHKMDMAKINLLSALFGLLTIAIIYFGMILIGNVPSLLSNGTIELVKPDDLDYSILFTSMVYLNLVAALLIISNVPLFLGLGGAIYSLSQIAYGVSNYSPTHDFFIGIKRNWKNNVLLSILFSLSFLFATLVLALYILNDAPMVVMVISFIIAGLVFAITNIITFIALNYNNVYSAKFIELLRNSLLLGISHPFKTIGCMAIAIIPFLLLFIPLIIPVFPILMILFGFVYYIVVEVLFTNSLFDKYINEKAHPEIVNRGMALDDKDKNNN